jgi:drug/metabolite transporter (DMT)-like permease
MNPAILMVLDYSCLIAALAAIGGYVLAFLRNRPYVRPLNSLGLLLTGAALLAAPTVVGEAAAASGAKAVPIVYLVALLVASVVFQLIAALRRRKPRAAE